MKRLYLFISIAALLCPAALKAQDTTKVALNSPLMVVPGTEITGAYSKVDGTTLEKFPVTGLQNTLPGMLSGLTTMTNNWIPGAIVPSSAQTDINMTMMIRGRTSINGYNYILVVIDGMICTSSLWTYITPNEIESVSIVKDAAAASIYGIQGAAGVMYITTKKGSNGPMRVKARFDQSVQQMTRRPEMIHSWEYAMMRNDAARNDGLAPYSQFSQEVIDKYRAGDDPLYPDNDWYGMFINDLSYMTRASVNISGGNSRIRYFTDLNYMHQTSPIKTAHDPARNYDPTGQENWFGMRSNIDMDINSWLSAWLRLSTNVQYSKRSRYTAATIYSHLLSLPPTLYGPLTPAIEDKEDPRYDSGNQVVATDKEGSPAYGLINRSGYGNDLYTTITAQSGIRADLSQIVKGLGAGVDFNYQTYTKHALNTNQNFELWIQDSPDALNFTQKGSAENTPLTFSKTRAFYYQIDIGGQLSYDRRFGDFSIASKAYLMYQRKELEATSGSLALPYKRESMGITATFGYADRYFLKGDFAYAGSEQFAPEHRFIPTYGVSAAWLASNEEFLKDVSFLDKLKLRASYGITANDNIGTTRFLYLDYVTYNGTEGLRGNPNVSAEITKGVNVGFDARIFNGISASFDWFSMRCDNMLCSSSTSVPIYQGVALSYYPMVNAGKMENKGYEVELGYDHRFGNGLGINIGGQLSYAHNYVIYDGEAPYGDDYAYQYRVEGYSRGQLWGYKVDYSNGSGMFNFDSEIAASGLTYASGTPRRGDLIYVDLNGDSIIDEKDLAPLGYTSTPEYNYGIHGGFDYKGFEFSFFLQGTAKASMFLSGAGAYETSYDGIYTEWHKTAWTEERWNNGEKITYPALSLNTSTNHCSNEFFLRDLSYLRLKNVELAYTLPDSVTGKIGKVRLSLSGQNLLTFDKLGFKYIDPESRSYTSFNPFRTYNFGIGLTF